MTNASPTTEANPPVLEMRGVTVNALRDPSRVLLEDINWSVRRGDYWAIGGLQRSGKSDLLNVAAGLQRPAIGESLLFGSPANVEQDESALPLRRRVGFVFDGGQLLNNLTLAENIALPLRYHAEGCAFDPAARLEALVALTDLEPWAGRRPSDVSRNWAQRFGLARALALLPELLLLDEPLSGLDPRDATWWTDTLESLAAGHAVLGGKPLTLVVTGNDLRPWRGQARQFGLLQDRTFVTVGERAALETHKEPVLTELLRPWQT